MLELFILKRKISGPCWLTISNAKKVNETRTWSKVEVQVDDPHHVEVRIDDLNKESPPLTALCFSIKTTRSQGNTNEIAMISAITHDNILQDKPTNDAKQGYRTFTLLRKLDRTPLP